MATNTMALQLPKFSAFITLSLSLLIFTNKVPMMLKSTPRPAITMGRRIGAMPPKLSWLTTSRPSTIVANIVAT